MEANYINLLVNTMILDVNMNGSLLIFFCFITIGFAQKQASACPPNETLDTCFNGLCQNQKCAGVGKPVGCPQVLKCIPGCKCANGQLRAKNGTCVSVKDCEPLACPEDGTYKQFKKPCPEHICGSSDPANDCYKKLHSKLGCFCLDGSFTDNLQTCDELMCNCPEISEEIWCIHALAL